MAIDMIRMKIYIKDIQFSTLSPPSKKKIYLILKEISHAGKDHSNTIFITVLDGFGISNGV